MVMLRDDEVTINLPLFKRYRFYQLFDPDSPKIFRYNAYRVMTVAIIVAVAALTVYSTLGFFVEMEDTVDSIDMTLTMFIYTVTVLSFLKIFVFLYNADRVWELFEFTRLDFLKSARCRENDTVLHKYRATSIKITNFFQNYFSGLFITWMLTPLILNTFFNSDSVTNQRTPNIFNLRFPVDMSFYNRNYNLFYVIEVSLGTFILYYSIIIDIFLISICLTTIAQYEVLNLALTSFGHEAEKVNRKAHEIDDKNDNLKAYEDFKSILSDQSHVYMKLKSFYSDVWLIVVCLIFGNSLPMVVLSYSFVLICMAESLSFFRLIKLPTTFFAFAIQLYMYCYLFDVVNSKKESFTFGLYSCNWTNMDLKFKKLLLFAMRMNNANQLQIKATPAKIVNLQLFASVMTTTYNIVSVMLNQTTKKVKTVDVPTG